MKGIRNETVNIHLALAFYSNTGMNLFKSNVINLVFTRIDGHLGEAVRIGVLV
jgi:hypothetical protein